jgi:serine/threonine protein kinase
VTIRVGDKFDSKYRILRLLGEGTFGAVYLAEDEPLSRNVAIKHFKRQATSDQSNLILEMKSLDQLHHPGIVTFYHHFVADGDLCLVMEYCPGGSLHGRVQGGPAPLRTVMQWGIELANVLELVHGRNIVHHDIKPDNIVVAEDGTLKIGDFGVANSNAGTPMYMAPEMLLGHVDSGDARVDVYALGITLLELLRNYNPFEDMNRAESLQAKLRHDFIPKDLEQWAQEVIAKATHPTPELRFQSMRDFREAIEAKHVSYVFDPDRIHASKLATRAEELLGRKKARAARKCVTQALHFCPDCVPALITAGRHQLFINRIDEAKEYFDRALSLNPGTNIQRELGWICLEQGNYAQAISLLTDHLQRDSSDYEAFNLLLECFYRTERFEAGIEVARLMIQAKTPSDCFLNGALICAGRAKLGPADLKQRVLADLTSPFIAYNMRVGREGSDLHKRFLFQNYRLGLKVAKTNRVRVEYGETVLELSSPIITVGRMEDNDVCIDENSVSRWHGLIVNYLDDVWVHDLDSSCGTFVDGARVNRKTYLDGVHIIKLGSTEIKIASSAGLLA